MRMLTLIAVATCVACSRTPAPARFARYTFAEHIRAAVEDMHSGRHADAAARLAMTSGGPVVDDLIAINARLANAPSVHAAEIRERSKRLAALTDEVWTTTGVVDLARALEGRWRVRRVVRTVDDSAEWGDANERELARGVTGVRYSAEWVYWNRLMRLPAHPQFGYPPHSGSRTAAHWGSPADSTPCVGCNSPPADVNDSPAQWLKRARIELAAGRYRLALELLAQISTDSPEARLEADELARIARHHLAKRAGPTREGGSGSRLER